MMSDWTSLGSITVTASDLSVVVGSFSIAEGDDTIWVDVQSESPETPWPWSYGILSWQTSFGREFGSAKAYTERAGEVVPIGVGRQPRSRTGSIIYEPRSFNLAWVKKGNPLSLSFSVASGVTNAGATTTGGGVAFPVQGGTWLYQSNSGLVQLQL